MALKYWRAGLPAASHAADGGLRYWHEGLPLGFLFASEGGQDIEPGSILSAEEWGTPELQAEQTVDPESIESAEAWGEPEVELSGIAPDSIESAEEWGEPFLFYDQNVSPGSIMSAEAWGTPNVAGPVNPGSILSGEEWGAPLLNVKQTVEPGSILSTEAWGEPTVRHVETISPGSIPSAEEWGAPTLSQNAPPIMPGSIESGEAWGSPDIGGGEETLQIFVGNYDRSRWLRAPSGVSLTQQNLGRWSGHAVFHNLPKGANGAMDFSALGTVYEFVPKFGMTVLIKEFGRTLFRGCIRRIQTRRHPTTNVCVYECDLADKGALCDRRVVAKYYPAASEPDAEQWDMSDVIRDIVANFLNGEGIAVDPDLPVDLGLLSAPIQQYITVSQAFDQLRDMLGYAGWFVDLTQTLIFAELPGVEEAPFPLLESGLEWRDLQVDISDEDYRNRQYVMSNRKMLDAQQQKTETYTLHRWGDRPNADIQPSIYDDEGGFQLRSFEYGFPPYVFLTSLGIERITSAKLNGNPVAVYLNSELTYDQYEQMRLGTTRTWVYDGGGSGVVFTAALFADPHTPLNSPGDVIEISYIPALAGEQMEEAEIPVFSVEEPIEPLPGERFGTCGSGRYEHVEQVNDVITREAGLALAQGILDRSGGIPKIARFETDVPGFQVGQMQHADVPRHMLDEEQLFITGLEGTSVEGTDLGHRSSFRWHVEASNRPDVGNWIKTWQRLWRRTQHPTPIDDLLTTTVVLGSGRDLRSGEQMNPGKIDAIGQLADVVALFLQPPVNQDLVIDIRLDGVSIFDDAKLVIPAGFNGDVRPAGYRQTPLYAFRDQTLTCHVSYRAKGGTPVAARNGTVKLRWLR